MSYASPRLLCTLAAGLACACSSATNRTSADARPTGLRQSGIEGKDDPTVWGARLFPFALDESRGWGTEPGGGARAIVAGMRVVSSSGGAILVASDRFPATPSVVMGLPERFGGGFVFSIGTHLWSAPSWLARTRALLTSPWPIAQVLLGLDRIYLRSPRGSLAAVDPSTGAFLDLGPVPGSPNVGRVAAFDAWRAIAVADLRGVVLTLDAGSTWQPLTLPIDPGDVVLQDGAIAIGGLDRTHQVQWWEVRPDGQTARLTSFSMAGTAPERASIPTDVAYRPFGSSPLLAAIEDGWPLADGTVLVARDGALGRVRLSDGALVEQAANAFPMKSARCHALSLRQARDPRAFGFVCGEQGGQTALYGWDTATASLVALRQFDGPREVLGFANGALAVRGSCATNASRESTGDEQPWCIMLRGGRWTETRGGIHERIVVLSDHRIVLVRPPRTGDLSEARLVIVGDGRRLELPLTFPSLRPEVANALRLGVWMDGFEERRPGVVGGWIDAAGAIMGIEIAANGETRVGEYIRDAGDPIASGRWAFGWTASRRGFETTDGGMTWTKEIAMPDPIASGRVVRERACGPVGCVAAGWLRVGWGDSSQLPVPEPRPRPAAPLRSPPNLELDCEPIVRSPPELEAAERRTNHRPAWGATATSSVSAGIDAGSTWATGAALPPFAGRRGPSIPLDDVGVSVEVSSGVDRALRGLSLARLYAWGPKTGDWDQLGRWQIRWQWQWGGRPDVRSSMTTPSPWRGMDAARRGLGVGRSDVGTWLLAEGDDPDHALLVGRHGTGTATADLVLLEAEHAPVETHRPGADPFPEVEGATRMAGRWYVATSQGPGELAATIVWSLEGVTAREIARVPRADFEARSALRLARRTDGQALGLVVDGQPDELRAMTSRWVAAIDVESKVIAAPELLAPTDLSDRLVSTCTGDDSGWQVDLPYPGAVRLHMGARSESVLQSVVARMRLSHNRACIERALGSVDAFSDGPPPALTRLGTAAHETARAIEVSVFSGRTHFALRCTAR